MKMMKILRTRSLPGAEVGFGAPTDPGRLGAIRRRATAFTAALLAAAAMASAGPAMAAPAAPAPGRVLVTTGQHYVLASQAQPNLWLGELSYDNIVARASGLWYGGTHDEAVWTATVSGGGVQLENYETGGYLDQWSGSVQSLWGDGNFWTMVPGAGGSFALRDRSTGRYLAVNAAGVAILAANAYFWILVNAVP